MQLPEVGDLFEGRYRIDAILGEGGFARVYAATSDGVQREVAIKVLKPHHTDGYDATIVARFLQEARVMSQLRDPHTITMYDCGRSTDGLLFMVCELLPGEDLSDLLDKRRKLSESEAMTVLRQILQSLREAHSVGLLHRDIKPGNIRVFEYMGEPLTVKVLDFGIAKSADLATQLTATGRVIGTPRYMSPEQLRGEELTPASDIYSAGLVAHEMLIGRQERTELVSQVILKPADLVSARVRELVNRMLEREVSARFENAQGVLDALDQLVLEPVSAPHEPQPGTLEPFDEPATSRDLPRSLAVDPATAHTTADAPQTPDEAKLSVQSWVTIVVFAIILVASAGGFFWLQQMNNELTGRKTYSQNTRGFGASAAPQLPPGFDPRTLKVDQELAVARPSDGPPAPAPAAAAPADEERDRGPCPGREVAFTGLGTKRFYDGLDRVGVTAYVPANYDPNTRHRVVFIAGDEGERRTMFADPELGDLAEKARAVLVPLDLTDKRLVVAEQVATAIEVADKAFCVDRTQAFAVATSKAAHRLLEDRCGLPLAGLITTGVGTNVRPCLDGTEVPHLHINVSSDPSRPTRAKARRKHRRECSVAVASFEEMHDELLDSYDCDNAKVSRLTPTCELRTCRVNRYATCHFGGGRIWRDLNSLETRRQCLGPEATSPARYVDAMMAFIDVLKSDP